MTYANTPDALEVSLDDLDWDDQPIQEAAPVRPERVRKHRSIVPPRPAKPAPPARRFAESGSAFPPYPAWEHKPAGHPTVPPFATAANLAEPSPNPDRARTLPPPPNDEPTTLDVHRLIQNAMQEAREQAVTAAAPSTPIPFQGAGDTLSPSAQPIPSLPSPKPRRARTLGIAAAGTLIGAAAAMAVLGVYVVGSAPTARCALALAPLSTSAAGFVGRKSEAAMTKTVEAPTLSAERACKVVGEKKQLLSSASTAVPMEAVANADTGRAAIALAASNGRPVGFALRLDTLRTERSTMGWAPAPLRRVTPMLGEDLSVATDLDPKEPDGLSYAVRAAVPLKLGTYRNHLTLTREAQLAEVLWSLPGSADALDAEADSEGAATVAVRSGKTVVLGSTDSMQRPDGALRAIADDLDASGAVRVARDGERAVVAFEVHTDAGKTIALVASEQGERTVRWMPAVPDAGANQQPGVAALSDGRWLLTWTERGASSSRVRMQTLDRWLRPVGGTEDVTAAGEGGSGSVVATVRDGGAVFYFRRGVSPREAWVASVRCP